MMRHRPRPPAPSDEEVVALREARTAGVPYSRLARAFDLHQATVKNYCRGRYRRLAGGPVTPAAHAKLDAVSLAWAALELADGATLGDVAEELGVTKSAIWLHVKKWRAEAAAQAVTP